MAQPVPVVSVNILNSPLVTEIPSWYTSSHPLDIQAWLNKVNNLKVALGATDEQIIRFVALKVSCKRSSTFVNDFIEQAESSGRWIWSDLRSAMVKEYDTVLEDWQIEAGLNNMRRRTHQPIMEFARAFEAEAAKATSFSNDRKVWAFINVIQPESLQVAAKQAYAHARLASIQPTVQKLAASITMLDEPRLFVVGSNQTQHAAGRSVTNSARTQDNIGPQVSSPSSSSASSGQWQNSRSSIPSNNQSAQPVSRPPPAANNNGWQIRCFNCQELGHMARMCPKQPSNAQNRSSVSTIAACTSTSRFTSSVVINGSVKTQALVDTGAQSNVVRAEFVDQVWPRPRISQSHRQLTSASEHALQVVGEAVLEVAILPEGRVYQATFVVVECCVYDLILGQPFIGNHVSSIDCVDGSLTFNGSHVHVLESCQPLTSKPAPSWRASDVQHPDDRVYARSPEVNTRFHMMTSKLVRVPAQSCGSIDLKASDDGLVACVQETVLFTPASPASVQLGLGTQPYLKFCSGGIVRISALNRSYQAITIPAGILVGYVELISLEDASGVPNVPAYGPVDSSNYVSSPSPSGHLDSLEPAVVNVIVNVAEAILPPSHTTYVPQSDMSSPTASLVADSRVNELPQTDSVVNRVVHLPHLDQEIILPATSSIQLTDSQFQLFVGLINDHSTVFGQLLDTQATLVVEHEIPTGAHRPIATRPYRVPVHLRQVLNSEIESMLSAGVIQPSHSPWSAPVVLVTKKDGSQRVCIDYRKLNSITARDQYPLPKISDILDSLADRAVVFSTLDLLSGFWQVSVYPGDRPKTAFTTESGHYEFCRMPFGLANSPATFQRLMDLVLREVRQFALCYVDDIIIFSESFEKHLEHLARVFGLLTSAGLIVKPKKCQFLKSCIRFLGHQVSAGIVEPDPEKIAAIRNCPAPTDRHGLQVVLGLLNYYRRFVPGFSSVAEPLNRLLRKGTVWNWSEECEKAFVEIKLFLTTSPVLALPHFDQPFWVHCDASATGMGAILTQIIHGIEKVVCYASKSLNQAERRYSATDRECLAIRWALRHWRTYLLGRRFTVITDHAALKWLFTFVDKDPHNRYSRMILELQQYDFDVIHRAGAAHANADALSRLSEVASISSIAGITDSATPALTVAAVLRSHAGTLLPRRARIDPDWISRNEEHDLTRALNQSWEDNQASQPAEFNSTLNQPAPAVDESLEPYQVIDDLSPPPQHRVIHSDVDLLEGADLAQAQHQDSQLAPLIKYLSTGTMVTQDERVCDWIREQAKHCRLNAAGALVTLSKPLGAGTDFVESRPVVPSSLRPLLLCQYHDDSIAGHLGETKTYERLVRRCYWSSMRRDIVDYVKSCDSCQQRKTPPNLGSDTIGTPVRQSFPFERISIDVLGPLPVTPRNNRYCLCIMDLFTSFPLIFPMSNQRTSTVATVLIERVFLEYGFASEVLSDRGSNFVSDLMNEVMALFRIRRITTLAYSPQTNGVVERMNHSLLSMLSHYLREDQRDWDVWIPYVLFGFRSAPHSTLGYSPFYMLYGREPRFPTDQLSSSSLSSTQAPLAANDAAYLSDVAGRFELARQAVELRLNAVDQARAVANSQIGRLRCFNIGDKVLRWQPQLKDPKGKSKKLARQWTGPFLIIDKNEVHNTYMLASLNKLGQPTKKQAVVCQASRLKRYYERIQATTA